MSDKDNSGNKSSTMDQKNEKIGKMMKRVEYELVDVEEVEERALSLA